MKKVYLVILALVLCLAPLMGSAASIDVLWYGDNYNSAISTFAAGASSWDPAGNGSLSWNLTFWSAGDATPDFTQYDVFVIGCSAIFGSGLDPARLLGAKSAIEAARGNRTFISGQDADWHIQSNGLNAAEGFVYNAVNWAASGTDLGIVALADGFSGSGSQWWLDSNSFLKDELLGYVHYFQEESVIIPPGMETYPVNEGLTTASLSNWGTSAHAGFDKTIPGYTSINDAGTTGFTVTIVTEGAEGGDTGGGDTGDTTKVPEPATLLLIGAGLLGLAGFGRKIKN